MKNKKNLALGILIGLILIIGLGTIIYRVLQDENKLTVTEKNFISSNKANLISVNVANNVNVFGSSGKGVFYDFLENFEKDRGLSFNIVTTMSGDNASGLSFTKGKEIPDGSKVFYTDHYVLVSKQHAVIANLNNFNSTVGIVSADAAIVQKYLGRYNLQITSYDDKDALLGAFTDEEVEYMLVPMIDYLDVILSELYSINYHVSDIKEYYYMTSSNDMIITSIMSKYYNVWIETDFKESFDKNEYELFTNKLKITQKELDIINRSSYTYGYIENAPYDIRQGGSYGGVTAEYLQRFVDFSGITIDENKYSDYKKFTRAISKNKVSLYVDYYNINTSVPEIDSNYNVKIDIVMNNSDPRVYSSVEALKDTVVYAKENTLVAYHLSTLGINVKTYKKDIEAIKLLKDNNIVALDNLNYIVFKEENENYSSRLELDTNTTYNFVSGNDSMFNRLLTYYVSTLDKNEMTYVGLDNYNRTMKSGTIVYKITKYALIIIVAVLFVTFIIYKLSKRVHIQKRIKRSDKMKYIDVLTSLKNRNFLSENLSIWNQNTIYPQAIIVIDLNSIQELNDTYGYQEGDKQIQAAANVLIKTQLDNSEIMRTDGNEFTIYLVGYNEKQILSYIKKLNKEFKDLPHDKKGAAIGFSMIEDDLKLIDDAINEATEHMRENKELFLGENDEKGD